MDIKRLFDEIRANLSLVIKHDTPYGKSLWDTLIDQHPVDIVDFLEQLSQEEAAKIFSQFDKKLRFDVFEHAPETLKVFFINAMPDQEVVEAFNGLSVDELTDLFDFFSDDELHY